MIGSLPLARTFVLGLGAARLLAGTLEAAAPQTFLRLLGAPAPTAGTLLGFRMKGGRDVALGLASLSARGDDDALAAAAAAAAVIDLVDGLAVAIDGGRSLNPPAHPAGAVLGIGVAGTAWWAARTLREPHSRRGRRRRPLRRRVS